MKNLKRLRKKIDRIDGDILNLLNERARITLEIGKLKSRHSAPTFSPVREAQVYKRLLRLNKRGPMQNRTVKAIYREIMSGSLSLQTALRVAYLGPEATFTYIAAVEKFGESIEKVECKSISDVFIEVERGSADYGVVPIENSTEGAVNHTLDMFVDSDLKICSEIYLPIHHNLISETKKMTDIKEIWSHPQVFAQCTQWIEGHLPNAKLIPADSTTTATWYCKGRKNRAAIASDAAAKKYDLNILAGSIEDSLHNITRFLIIGNQEVQPTRRDKTSIVFSMKDRAGALHDVLVPFKKNKINLTKIESRPSKKRAWKYYFFVDLEGHHEDKKVKKALASLSGKCVFLKVLGSYPKVQ
ncbi:MAG: prephenate dehydratase [Candidatus Omnitrophica bacterium]|nr:prephenate dehydratase [Candidatus Omnitrophota bacterium]